MSRFVKVGLLALVGVVILIAVALHLWLGALIKSAVEQVGPEVTGSSVTLQDVDIGLLAGRAQIEGLGRQPSGLPSSYRTQGGHGAGAREVGDRPFKSGRD